MALSISGCPFQSVPLRDQQLDAAEGLQRPTQPIDTDEPLQDQAQGQDPCVALPLTQGHALPSPSTLQTIEPLAGREYWEARMGFKMLRPEGVQNKLTRRQLRQLDRWVSQLCCITCLPVKDKVLGPMCHSGRFPFLGISDGPACMPHLPSFAVPQALPIGGDFRA